MLERITDVSDSTELQIKWVAFRDYDCSPFGYDISPFRKQILESSEWTNSSAELAQFVETIGCGNGYTGDEKEAIEWALKYAHEQSDRPNAAPPTRIMLLGDAPPHLEGKGNQLTNYARTQLLETDYKEQCGILKDKEIPVYTFYMSANARDTFKEIAGRTGGKAQELNCEKDATPLLDAACQIVLNDMGGEKMEKEYQRKYMHSSA
jgi:hypothetical protein